VNADSLLFKNVLETGIGWCRKHAPTHFIKSCKYSAFLEYRVRHLNRIYIKKYIFFLGKPKCNTNRVNICRGGG
jgi:hypothetical protein